MLRYCQQNLHASTLMLVVGAFSSLFTTIPLVFLFNRPEWVVFENVYWVYVAVASTAFLVFSNFNQIISARHVLWILRNGLLRWTRILLVLVISLLFSLPPGQDPYFTQSFVLSWSFVSLPLLILSLTLSRFVIYKINNLPSNIRKAVFLGLGPQASLLCVRLLRSPILGIKVVGYYAAEPIKPQDMSSQPPEYLGRPKDALPHLRASEYDIVFIQPDQYYDDTLSMLLHDALNDSSVASIYMMQETNWSSDFAQVGAEIAGVPLLALHDSPISGVVQALKRLFDLILGGVALVLVSPVMFIIAIAVKLDSPGPILFRQARYGERGKKFNIYKFRSMYIDSDKDGSLRQASQDDPRITAVGRFLRRKSLDELPQLFNVMNGTMSLVGPRPHAVSHNEEYRRLIAGYMLRHSIKPGITGWAQINGFRGETDTLEKMQKRIEYDRYYIKNWSLGFDIRILFRTLFIVIYGKNAY